MRKKLTINKRSTEPVKSQGSLPNETNSASLLALHKESHIIESSDIHLNVDLARNHKKGSISWECLPFTSKKGKQTSKSSSSKPSKKSKLSRADDNDSKKSITTLDKITDKSNSEDDAYESMSTVKSKPKKNKPASPQKQHQPYAASLVNNGFGFGFDLQGGDGDNQLTFIDNVIPNGDAARKGLSDGDILVSINGKNVIGIRRSAIERILKQYKVDQEIEIVVCRLKEPSFILNLSKLIANHSALADQKPINQQFLEASIAKYRLLNDQIFNELITFQDPTFKNSQSTRSSIKSTNSSNKSRMSSQGHECIDDRYNMIEESRRDKTFKSEKKILNPTFNDKNSILISVPVKGGNDSTMNDLDESLISIELPNKRQSESLDVTNQRSVKYRQQSQGAVLRRPNTGLYSHVTDSGYADLMSSKSNKSTAYYSDISITVYDQMNHQNVNSSIGGSINGASTQRGMNKSSQSVQATSNADVIMVQVTQQAKSQNIHPQIQPASQRNHSQSAVSHMIPIGMTSSKSMSVNDFTGSILAADRVNYYNKQHAAAAAAAALKMNKNIMDSSEPLYSNVSKKEKSSNDLSRYIRSGSVNSSETFINQQSQPKKRSDQSINIQFEKTQEQHYVNALRSVGSPYDEITKRRTASEHVTNKNKLISIPIDTATSSNSSRLESEIIIASKDNKIEIVPGMASNNNLIVTKPASNKSKSSSSSSQSSLSINQKIKKSSDGGSSCSSESISSINSHGSALKLDGDVSLINSVSDDTESAAQIIKRLAELEGINKKNIEQLKKLEQDYSSQSNIEIPINIQLAKNKSKAIAQSSKKSEQLLDEKNKNIKKSLLPQPTNSSSRSQKSTSALSSSSMASPLISPQTSAQASSSQISPQDNTKISLESSFNSTNSSSSSAMSNIGFQKNSTDANFDLQSSIDIEIYNTSNQDDLFNSYKQRSERPKVNQRKQKAYRIECTDESVTTQGQSDNIQSLLLCNTKSNNSSNEDKLKTNIDSSESTKKLGDLAKSVYETNASEQYSTLLVKTSEKSDKEVNDFSSTPSDVSPVTKSSIRDKSYDVTDSDQALSNSKQQHGSLSSLCGSLERQNREKHLKKRKVSHRNSLKIKRSQTADSLVNRSTENLKIDEIKPVKSQKEKEFRRDRRLRHTMPISCDRLSLDRESLHRSGSLAKDEIISSNDGIAKEPIISSSSDDEKKTCYLKPKPPSIQRRERGEKRITAELSEFITQDGAKNEEQKTENVAISKVIEWKTADNEISSPNENNLDTEDAINISEVVSQNEITFSDIEMITTKAPGHITSSMVVNNESKLSSDVVCSLELEDNAATQSFNLPEDASVSALEKNGSKSDTEGLSADRRNNIRLSPSKSLNKSLRKKHDSTDTIDSVSSYECRFERISLSEKQQSLKLKLEAKNKQWNLMNKNEDDTVIEDKDVVDAEAAESEIVPKNDQQLDDKTEMDQISAVIDESIEILEREAKANNETRLKTRTETTDTEVSVCSVLTVQNSIASNAPTNNAPTSIFDDGYGSTVSIKNATNESYSSIDDGTSEISSQLSSMSNASSFNESRAKNKCSGKTEITQIKEIPSFEEETKSIIEKINTELEISTIDQTEVKTLKETSNNSTGTEVLPTEDMAQEKQEVTSTVSIETAEQEIKEYQEDIKPQEPKLEKENISQVNKKTDVPKELEVIEENVVSIESKVHEDIVVVKEPLFQEETVVLEGSTIVQENIVEPILAEKPLIQEENVALEGSTIIEENIVPEEPILTEKPLIQEETIALEGTTIIEENIVPEEPILAEKPLIQEETIALEGTTIVEENIVLEEPKAQEIIADASEQAIVDKNIVSEESKHDETPLIQEESVVLEESKVAQENIVQEIPIVQEASVVMEEMAVIEKSVVSEEPKAQEDIVVASEQSVVEENFITEEPKLADKPLVLEETVAFEELSVVEENIVSEESIDQEEKMVTKEPTQKVIVTEESSIKKERVSEEPEIQKETNAEPTVVEESLVKEESLIQSNITNETIISSESVVLDEQTVPVVEEETIQDNSIVKEDSDIQNKAQLQDPTVTLSTSPTTTKTVYKEKSSLETIENQITLLQPQQANDVTQSDNLVKNIEVLPQETTENSAEEMDSGKTMQTAQEQINNKETFDFDENDIDLTIDELLDYIQPESVPETKTSETLVNKPKVIKLTEETNEIVNNLIMQIQPESPVAPKNDIISDLINQLQPETDLTKQIGQELFQKFEPLPVNSEFSNQSSDANEINSFISQQEPSETYEMSNEHEPLPSPPKELPHIETSPEIAEIKPLSDASITSSTTVFTYKNNAEKVDSIKPELTQEIKPEPVIRPVSPVIKTETLTETITTTNKFSAPKQLSPSKFQNESRFNSMNSSVTKESYASDIYSPQYRSTISPRHTVISRRNNSDRSINVSNYNSMNHSGFTDSPISMRPVSHQTLVLKESRQKEKQQLGELNDRFAGYVERVRFLEAQNKKLQMELGSLKDKWGSESKQIEQMYKIELEEARTVLKETSKSKDCVQIFVNKQEEDLENIKRKYNEVEGLVNKEKERANYLQEQISANESEISLLKRRLQDLNDEEKRCKQEAVHMMNEITRVSFELETEMKNRLMLENDKQSLEEELIFLKEVHAKEIEELKQMQFHQQGIDPAVFFKNELSHAIKEIRDEYNSSNQTQRSELEGWYRIKISEIQRRTAQKALTAGDEAINREQVRKLKVQISDTKRDSGDLKAKNADMESRIRDLEEEIRREHEESKEAISTKDNEFQLLTQSYKNITSDYEELMLSKTDLETEIRTYRKLLEGEEEKDGLKQIVEGIEKRARHMSVNKDLNQSYANNMNRSYTVDTGYTSVRQSKIHILRHQSKTRPSRLRQFRTTTF